MIVVRLCVGVVVNIRGILNFTHVRVCFRMYAGHD